jgi:hypothetical protein
MLGLNTRRLPDPEHGKQMKVGSHARECNGLLCEMKRAVNVLPLSWGDPHGVYL